MITKRKEPVFIVKPALKNFGLDYLHIILIALVIILIALAFALSTFKQGTIITNCQNSTTSSIGACKHKHQFNTYICAGAQCCGALPCMPIRASTLHCRLFPIIHW
jgi:hypothetical protein